MNINGYELGEIAFMTAQGPLWATRARDGSQALLTLFSSSQGSTWYERWRKWAGLTHPGVVRLLDVVRHEDGRWALIQERVEGKSLDLLLHSSDLRSRKAKERIINDIADALLALHGVGIIHADVSPANIIVRPDGSAVLIDLMVSPDEGGGTPGWSLDHIGAEDADWHALARIANALDVNAPSTSPSKQEQTHHCLDAIDEVGQCDPAQDFRTVALRAPTIAVQKKKRSTVVRVAGIVASLVILGGLSFLAVRLLAGSSKLASAKTPADHPPSLSQVVGQACASREEAVKEIGAILRARDAALTAQDPRLLEGSVGGALAQQDRERIALLTDSGQRIEGLHTKIEILSDPRCDDERRTIAARLSQGRTHLCTNGECHDLDAPEPIELELSVSQDAWIALEARALH